MKIWKDIKGYEGLYQASEWGEIRSLSRLMKNRHNGFSRIRRRILSQSINSGGRYCVTLSKDGKGKSWKVHQLIAMAFLKHTPCGFDLVVNHKDLNPLNNNLDNLEIITQRENANQKHLKSSSKYIGASWIKEKKKWRATIWVDGKSKHLGYFTSEYKAHLEYLKALNALNKQDYEQV